MPHHSDSDTVARFNDRAADYVRYRPTYPAAAVRAILDSLGPPAELVAADIGAGTEMSARLLGDQGVQVLAIEPGEAMRQAAAPHPNVTWVAARADATGLRRRASTWFSGAQSFHWFQAADALVEFARILKPGRRLAIVGTVAAKPTPSRPATVGRFSTSAARRRPSAGVSIPQSSIGAGCSCLRTADFRQRPAPRPRRPHRSRQEAHPMCPRSAPQVRGCSTCSGSCTSNTQTGTVSRRWSTRPRCSARGGCSAI